MNAEPPRGGDAPDEGFVALLAAHLDKRAAGPDESTADETDAAESPYLMAVAEQLSAEPAWSGPPPALRDSILAAARAGKAPAVANSHAVAEVTAETTPETVPDVVPEPAPELEHPSPPGRAWWHPERWFPQLPRMAWAIPTAVVAAAVFTFAVLAVDRALVQQPDGEPFAAAGTTLAPQATATGEIVAEPGGFSITIQPERLPAAAPGSYYAAWLTGPAGKVPIGSFHWRRTGAPIELWSGVDPAAYPTLSITLQAEGDPPTPSTLVVMTADLAP
ncbi:anti-sigma factor [Actinoplanes sp. NPDC051861]|uniref:anti-sigma factor n=1 Tax=Actinoplanes sp. NPDC051861 TaxID=3155170 RepID=UPI0034319D9D